MMRVSITVETPDKNVTVTKSSNLSPDSDYRVVKSELVWLLQENLNAIRDSFHLWDLESV